MVSENLGTLFRVKSGDGIAISNLKTYSEYPVYGGNGINGYTSNYNVEEKTLVIGRVGEKCGNVNITLSKSWVSDNALIVIPKTKYDIEYLSYLLKYLKLNDYANRNAQPVISGQIIYAIEAPYENDEEEQREIAKSIATFDTYINDLTELIEKKKGIRDGALEDLVSGRIRIEGFTGEWDYTTLKELCYLITKQTGFDYTESIKDSLVKAKSGDVLPFIQNKDFEGHNINYNTDYYIPRVVAENFPKILLNEKCVLISISGKLGNVGLFDRKRSAFVGGAICVAKLIDKEIAEWIVCYLQSPAGQHELLKSEKASSHRNITVEDIRNIDIPIPEEKERDAIAGILRLMDDEITSLEEEKEKMLQIKAGAMEDLLTGKVRLIKQGG